MSEKIFLGHLKIQAQDHLTPRESVYLTDFEWACGWYWSGGYIGNSKFHCHFDGCFLNVPDRRGHPLGNFITPWDNDRAGKVVSNGCAVWEDLSFFLDHATFTGDTWWRMKDLFKQFYRLRDAAEVFQYGGHCTSTGRTEAEINKGMAKQLNCHIAHVIIPEIRKLAGFTSPAPLMRVAD